ncbi:MAG: hypothetical protein NDI69_07155 [Bacteriovoracaceae bacterium]|nr:hypothetical protein [Bacteriovoracaceae bacterium]
MKPYFYVIFLVLAACGAKERSFDYGKTTVSELKAEMGEPIEEKSIPVKDSKVLVFEGNEKYQVTNDVVTNGFRDPKGNEQTLLYWKHKFSECDTVTSKISGGTGHELGQYELKCPAQGISVIYSEGSGSVSRVVEHEKK